MSRSSSFWRTGRQRRTSRQKKYDGFSLLGTLALTILLSIYPAAADDVEFGFAVRLGGEEFNYAGGIELDAAGNLYVGGTRDEDAVVYKLDSNGEVVWTKQVGGKGSSVGWGHSLDPLGNVYITGLFQNTVDFDPGDGKVELTEAGRGDIFICKLDSDGKFVWAKGFGGREYDNGLGITLDASGNVYTAGLFNDTVDFDPTGQTFDLDGVGFFNIFVLKLAQPNDD
jgi:hypothetical protein